MKQESYILIITACVFIFLGVRSIYKKQVQILSFVYIAIGLTSILFAFYVSGRRVNHDEFGTPAEFGQFGDYFGGLLNPIFGLITILVLLYSIKIELKNSDKNNAKRERTELHDYLIRCLKSFEDDLKKSEFMVSSEPPQSFLQRYVSPNGHFKTELANELLYLIKRTEELNHPNTEAHPSEPEQLLMPFARLRTKVLRIVDEYCELIKTSEHRIIKHGMKYDLSQWLIDQSNRGLLTYDEKRSIEVHVDTLFESKQID